MKKDHISAHLEVPKSVHADAGVYTITLENKLGSATASINVKVIGNHSFDETPDILHLLGKLVNSAMLV